MRNRLAAALGPPLSALALAGCGIFGPETCQADGRILEVDAGDEFTLSLPASPSMGENWYAAGPRPDRDVVRLQGQDQEYEDDGGNVGGGGGTQPFTFRAIEPGT